MNFIKNNFFQILTLISSISILFIQFSQNKKIKQFEQIEHLKINNLNEIITNILKKYDILMDNSFDPKKAQKSSKELAFYLRDIRTQLLTIASPETLILYQGLRSVAGEDTQKYSMYFNKFMCSLINDIRLKKNLDSDLIVRILLNFTDREYEKFKNSDLYHI